MHVSGIALKGRDIKLVCAEHIRYPEQDYTTWPIERIQEVIRHLEGIYPVLQDLSQEALNETSREDFDARKMLWVMRQSKDTASPLGKFLSAYQNMSGDTATANELDVVESLRPFTFENLEFMPREDFDFRSQSFPGSGGLDDRWISYERDVFPGMTLGGLLFDMKSNLPAEPIGIKINDEEIYLPLSKNDFNATLGAISRSPIDVYYRDR